MEVSLVEVLNPAGWQAGRKAFKSSKSWKYREGKEVEASKEEVFAWSLPIFYVPNISRFLMEELTEK